MPSWLAPALEYLASWLEFQRRGHDQPGCVVAVAYRGRVVLDKAFGYADLRKRTPLTPRHRFRVASHSKSFTAAGILKLRAQRRLRLDDRIGRYVKGLHPAAARATLEELLSHGAGLVRDGRDSGQFQDRRPFLSREEVLADLKAPPILRRGARFKYSNHGYALLGMAIEAVTGEPYREWIAREILAPAGLEETTPDMPLARGTPFARGHTGKMLAGRPLVIPGDFDTRAIGPAGGFVSTAADMVRFFWQLRDQREMIRARWRDPHSSIERYYGLGIVSGTLAGWKWYGHSGGLQGYITRTVVVPRHELSISVLTNSIIGPAHAWVDGAMHILRTYKMRGGRRWRGRWWNLWGAIDLVPVRGKLLVTTPAYFNPFVDASEIRGGRIVLAGGYVNHGERVRLGKKEIWLGASRLLPEAVVAREIKRRYGSSS
jgi:D-alanyl-D-alanine carboxypeptidase